MLIFADEAMDVPTDPIDEYHPITPVGAVGPIEAFVACIRHDHVMKKSGQVTIVRATCYRIAVVKPASIVCITPPSRLTALAATINRA